MEPGGDVQWLDQDQQRIWRSWLDVSARIAAYLDADLRAHGLDLAEYEILVRLSEAEGRRLRMSDLAERANQSRSRLTHAVSRMEDKAWVQRHSAPDDRRGVVAELTDAGFELLQGAAPGHVAAVRRILVDVADPDDLQAMGRVLQAVLAVAD